MRIGRLFIRSTCVRWNTRKSLLSVMLSGNTTRGVDESTRTKALAFGVYRGGETAARRRPRGWVDLASQNSLLPYAVIYDTLASALATRDPQTAARAATLRA